LTVTADVARVDELDRLVGTVGERFGQLDGVVASAGAGMLNRTAQVTETDFDNIVDTNFKGAFFTVQKSLPLLTDAASVVLIGSWTVARGMALGAVYSASKAAVRGLVGALAADLADRSVRVNSVTPGHISTPMLDGITGGAEHVREMFRNQVALGRLGDPRDVAEVIVFLLSSRACYLTGQDIVVDGGLLGAVPLAG
jgi:NAD(P)-dependent dehydrogenase (short-subunit alcohol dehydrogenase family)